MISETDHKTWRSWARCLIWPNPKTRAWPICKPQSSKSSSKEFQTREPTPRNCDTALHPSLHPAVLLPRSRSQLTNSKVPYKSQNRAQLDLCVAWTITIQKRGRWGRHRIYRRMEVRFNWTSSLMCMTETAPKAAMMISEALEWVTPRSSHHSSYPKNSTNSRWQAEASNKVLDRSRDKHNTQPWISKILTVTPLIHPIWWQKTQI